VSKLLHLTPLVFAHLAIEFASEQILRTHQGETMRLKSVPVLILAALFAAAALPVSAQSNASGEKGGWPVAIGTGYSAINMDWGRGSDGNPRIVNGITVWVDWYRIPFAPNGFGIEAEGEHVNWNQPTQPVELERLRIDTALMGPIYRWRHYQRFNLYGKGVAGIGSIDFPPVGHYSHDTRTVWAPGFGGNVLLWGKLWARADYEYQFWPQLFGPHALNPHGYTLGLSYDFSTPRREY
jgi:Outer membrane protein beta-barrel domain